MRKLKAYLSDAGKTQSEFAAAMGVSQPTVSDWVNGEARPSIENLIVISRITGLPIDDLVRDLGTQAAAVSLHRRHDDV